ncbi:HGGxSTG domain-containing protein [Methylobacterium sp. CB376]
MANGRCRMHGGASTGPKTPEGLARARRGNWRHGRRAAEAVALRRAIAQAGRDLAATIRATEAWLSGRNG